MECERARAVSLDIHKSFDRKMAFRCGDEGGPSCGQHKKPCVVRTRQQHKKCLLLGIKHSALCAPEYIDHNNAASAIRNTTHAWRVGAFLLWSVSGDALAVPNIESNIFVGVFGIGHGARLRRNESKTNQAEKGFMWHPGRVSVCKWVRVERCVEKWL